MPGRVLLVLALLMLFGCLGPVGFTRLTDAVYPAVSQEDVEVFVGEQPLRQYVRIALISTNLPKEKFAANLAVLKRQAAELGADAIILVSAQKSTLRSMLFSELEIPSHIAGFQGDAGYRYSAYAIRYLSLE